VKCARYSKKPKPEELLRKKKDTKNWDLHRLLQYFMSEPIEAIEKREKGKGKKGKRVDTGPYNRSHR